MRPLSLKLGQQALEGVRRNLVVKSVPMSFRVNGCWAQINAVSRTRRASEVFIAMDS